MQDKLLNDARKHFTAKDPAKLADFMATFCAQIPEEDLQGLKPEVLAGLIRRHWELSRNRERERPAIDVYTIPAVKGEAGRTAIDIVNDDMPFLVDSVTAELARHYRLIHLLVHPILQVRRDKRGSLISFSGTENHQDEDDEDANGLTQSHIHIQLQGMVPESMVAQLIDDLQRVLRDVRLATRDWIPMREKLRACQKSLSRAPHTINEEDLDEYLFFLEYMYKDNFTLLGYREYKFGETDGAVTSDAVPNASLGLLRDDIEPVYLNENREGLSPELQKLRRDMPPLSISKINQRATVHRSVPMDAVAVKQYDEDGNIVGEALFLGLFTSVTYSRSVQDIPYLRRKADLVMRKSGFRPGSHDYKALRHIIEKYPRDELFQITVDHLLETAVSILQLQERQRIALYMRPDLFGRYISCLVYVPRDRYDTGIRIRMQNILEEALGGICGSFFTTQDDSPLARVMYIIYTPEDRLPDYERAEIEARLQDAGRAWSDKLHDALSVIKEEQSDVAELAQRYGNAFPVNYCTRYEPKQAVYDIEKIEQVMHDNRFGLDLYCDKACEAGQVRLKIYHMGEPVILSDILPILENMGLRVIAELPFEIKPAGAQSPVWIHDFMMVTDYGTDPVYLEKIKALFEDALAHIWSGAVENDYLNVLVLRAHMTWQDIIVLRAYVRYLRQSRYPFGTRYIERTLTKHAAITRHIADLFHARFDPKAGKDRKSACAGHVIAIEHALDHVASLDEDRILRAMTALVQNTLRTNFYQRTEDGALKPAISLKFDSSRLDLLPEPKPFRDIFVYSPRIEGIHLRGDWVARGGLRWSDRPEDFRTEVLGLMKAQQVKNAVIVPMGAKGGFVVKQPPTEGGREAMQAEGIACYKIFIRALLDITDNRKGTKIVPPKNVVRHDPDDPYLVVAADKGTATFSDIANAISLEYGHWLGDAFASGGSAGYDHKKMGITARGAWESVKRHFREFGHDTQSEVFDVIGVGDMGGDVFGNGMLLSRSIRLVGAFNHLHIFCDPNPDPAKSFAERQRLFDNVKGWDHYNEKCLSKGGRIYNRSDKNLELTPEIRARFEIESERVTPSELIQAMMKAQTDLIWFGGIGTYIKGTNESHADVGDKANDALRIDARDVRARVIGEGANLAITQHGRVEFARLGGRINTDFIDNSAGVDSSDNEVNIKILLAEVMENHPTMTLDKRNKLLESMTEEVASLVLSHNYQQVQGLSLAELRSPENLPIQAQFIRDLEKHSNLNRTREGLPDEEALDKRLENGKGLLRPELSVLVSYAKILFTQDLIKSDVPDQPELERWLVDYFPTPLRKKYLPEIRNHRLWREIIATMLANDLVNRMGPTFVKEMVDKTGATAADVARAYIIVREAFGLPQLWADIESLDNKVPADIQLRAMREIAQMVEREVTWFLTRLAREMDINEDVKIFSRGVKTLCDNMQNVVTPNLAEIMQHRQQAAEREGLPDGLAEKLALIPMLGAACDIIRISIDSNNEIARTASTYYALGEHFHIDWLRRQARLMAANDRWTSEALDGLVEQLYSCQSGLTIRILQDMDKAIRAAKTGPEGKDPILTEWIKTHAHQAYQLEPLLEEMRHSGALDLPMLVIAVQKLNHLYGG